jgi:hypothetical protein
MTMFLQRNLIKTARHKEVEGVIAREQEVAKKFRGAFFPRLAAQRDPRHPTSLKMGCGTLAGRRRTCA